MIDVLRCENREMVRCRKFCHGIEPDCFLWGVSVGKHGNHFEDMPQKRPYAHTADVAVRQDTALIDALQR